MKIPKKEIANTIIVLMKFLQPPNPNSCSP